MPETREDFFSAFVEVSKAISSTLNLDEVLNLIVEHAIRALSLKAGAISLLNRRENRLEMIVHKNLSERFLKKGPVKADKSMPAAILEKKPVIIPDIDHDDQLQYPEECKREGIRAILSIPIVYQEEVIGTLRLYDNKPRYFNENEIDFMVALAEMGAVAIENARFAEQVKREQRQELDDIWNWFKGMFHTPKY